MGATFNRLKNWIAETLNYADLNAEIDNILTNLTPAGVDDYSANVAQMKLQTSPGALGTESLAQSEAGEIERLRYVIARIIGNTYWYEAPANSLASITASLETVLAANRIESGKTRTDSSQPIFLKPNGAALTASVQAASTNLLMYINSTLLTVTTDVTSPSLVGAPSTNNTALVNDAGLAGGEDTRYVGEFGTTLPIDTAGSEITALVGKLAAFKINNGVSDEYFIARVKSATELTEVRRGFFFDSSDNPVPRITISDNNTITLLKLAYVFMKSDGTLTASYEEPIYAGTEPSSPASGQYWFDTINNTWERFDGASFISAGAHLIGWAASTSAATVAARSADFSKAHSDTNTIELFKFDNTQVRAKQTEAQITVYGTGLKFGDYLPRWDMDSDLDSGLVEAAETLYYLYVTEGGKPKISTQGPMDRRGDLRGLYHPHQTWRCVGQFYNDASSNAEAVISYSNTNLFNFAMTHKVSGNALTVILHKNPVIPFYLRSSSNVTGELIPAAVLPKTSLVISSGSTLGTSDGKDATLVAHIVEYSGRAELALSFCQYPSTVVVSTTAEDNAGGADSALLLYSEVARTDVSVRAIAEIQSNQTTAGTWATALNSIRLGTEANPIRKRNRVIYTSSDTFVVPPGVLGIPYLLIGGGGGGGGNPSGSSGGGGGGGGGEIVEGIFPTVPNESLTITIGAAGAAGAAAAGAGGNGGTGGTSSIAGALRTVSARGGGYGGGAAAGQAGQNIKHYSGGTATATAGGDGAGGHGPGGNGSATVGGTPGFSGGGGGAQNSGGGGQGGDGGPSKFAAGGTGGAASANRSAGGGGGAGLEAGGNGTNAGTSTAGGIGAGGGGAGQATGTGAAGSAGGAGYCMLTWEVT